MLYIISLTTNSYCSIGTDMIMHSAVAAFIRLNMVGVHTMAATWSLYRHAVVSVEILSYISVTYILFGCCQFGSLILP